MLAVLRLRLRPVRLSVMTPLTPSQLSALEPLLREYVSAECDGKRGAGRAFRVLRRLGATLALMELPEPMSAQLCALALHLIEENRRLREAGK